MRIVTLNEQLRFELHDWLETIDHDSPDHRSCKPERLDYALALMAINSDNPIVIVYLALLANYYYENPVLRADAENHMKYSELP